MEKNCGISAKCDALNTQTPATEVKYLFPVENEVALVSGYTKLKVYLCTEEVPEIDMVNFYINHNQYPKFHDTFLRFLADMRKGNSHKLPEWLMKCFLHNRENPEFADLIENFYYASFGGRVENWQRKGQKKFTFITDESNSNGDAFLSKVIECNSNNTTRVKLQKSYNNAPHRDFLNKTGDEIIKTIFQAESRKENSRAERFLCRPLRRTNDEAYYELIGFEYGGRTNLMSGSAMLENVGSNHLGLILDSLCGLALMHEYGYENLDFAMENIAVGSEKTLTGKSQYYGKTIDYESICPFESIIATDVNLPDRKLKGPSSRIIQAYGIKWYPFRTNYFNQECFSQFLENKEELKGKPGSAAAGACIASYLRFFWRGWNELNGSENLPKLIALNEIVEKLQNPAEKFFARDAARILAEVTGLIDHPDYEWLKNDNQQKKKASSKSVKAKTGSYSLTNLSESSQYAQCTLLEGNRVNHNNGK